MKKFLSEEGKVAKQEWEAALRAVSTFWARGGGFSPSNGELLLQEEEKRAWERYSTFR